MVGERRGGEERCKLPLMEYAGAATQAGRGVTAYSRKPLDRVKRKRIKVKGMPRRVERGIRVVIYES